MSTPVPSAIQAPVSRRLEWLAIGLLSAAVFAARWAAHPVYLWDWDCVAFADALHHFDVTRNQPQPPGFLLFILAGRAAFYSKAEFQLNTSAQPLEASFQALRKLVREALQLPA